MGTLLGIAGWAAIAAMIGVALRYVWSRAGITFPAWGAWHYRAISGTDEHGAGDRA